MIKMTDKQFSEQHKERMRAKELAANIYPFVGLLKLGIFAGIAYFVFKALKR